MKAFLEYAKGKFRVDFRLLVIYALVYFFWGLLMNAFGEAVQIARFTHWWQVITVYLVYMIPVSLLLRGLPFHMQYAYGFVAMGLLEFSGYALGTSFAYPDNLLDQLFSIRNFSLAMALFFAFYFPVGNWVVEAIYSKFFGVK